MLRYLAEVERIEYLRHIPPEWYKESTDQSAIVDSS
jgi:hypothetical protein